MKVSELAKKLNLTYVSGENSFDREISGCYIGDLLSLAMAKLDIENIWITIQTNINVVAVASLKDASCVIVADGFHVDDDAKAKAEAEEIIILETEISAYEIAKKLVEIGI